MDNTFIQKVTMLVKNKNAKAAISAELESHILDKIDFYTEIGYSKEEAEKKATEDMGSAEDTAIPLNGIHSQRWYKQTENWVTIIILAAMWVVTFIFKNNFTYDTASNIYSVTVHYITLDFASLVIFALFFFILCHARRTKNKITVIALLVFIIAVNFTGGLQPMFYAVLQTISMLTSGYDVGGYIDSIFQYSYVPSYLGKYLSLAAATLTALAVLYCVFVILGIYTQECGKTGKSFWKPYIIIQRTAAVLLGIYFIFMAICTAIAYTGIETQKEKINSFKKQEIDFILNSEPGTDSQEYMGKIYTELQLTPSYCETSGIDYVDNIYYFNRYNITMCYMENQNDHKVQYTALIVTNPLTDFALINNDLYLEESDFADIMDSLECVNYTAADDNSPESYVDIWQTKYDSVPIYIDSCKFLQDNYYLDKISALIKSSSSADSSYSSNALSENFGTVGVGIITDNSEIIPDVRVTFILKNSKYKSATLLFIDNKLEQLQLSV